MCIENTLRLGFKVWQVKLWQLYFNILHMSNVQGICPLFLFFLWKIFTSACDISPIIVRAWRLLQAFASCKPWNAKNKDGIIPFSSALRKEITLRLGFQVWQVKLWQLYSTYLTSLGCGKTQNVTFMKQSVEFHWPETSWCRYVVKSHM